MKSNLSGRSPLRWPAAGPWRVWSDQRPGQVGLVTAETAIASMGLVMVAVAMFFVLAVGMAQVRCIDASRDVARALARGESERSSLDIGRRTAPAGATFETNTAGGVVLVDVQATVAAPGMLRHFGAVRVRSTSAVATEPGVGRSAGTAP